LKTGGLSFYGAEASERVGDLESGRWGEREMGSNGDGEIGGK